MSAAQITLSTHVLDTMRGIPASGVAVQLTKNDGLPFHGETDDDGRCPMLRALILSAGVYRLAFGVADYFRQSGVMLADPPFLDWVALEFGLSTPGHYHVPLLVSPFAYSTYRGS